MRELCIHILIPLLDTHGHPPPYHFSLSKQISENSYDFEVLNIQLGMIVLVFHNRLRITKNKTDNCKGHTFVKHMIE